MVDFDYWLWIVINYHMTDWLYDYDLQKTTALNVNMALLSYYGSQCE